MSLPMNLLQLLTRVARGPVGDLAVGGDSSGEIPHGNVPRVTQAIQTTLTKLHTRFPLQLKLLTLAVVDGVFVYPLRPEFAQSSASAEINKFIQDSVEAPYTGDLLAIEHILDENSAELPINVRRDPMSWFTPAYDTLHCAYPVTGETYFVQYRADHAPLELGALVADPEDPESVHWAGLSQKILIPAAMEVALMAGIAYEVYCSVSSADAQSKAQMHMQAYEQACAELELRNTLNGSVTEDRADAVQAGGWV